MVLTICAEAFWRLLFHALKFSLDHWLLLILALLLFSKMKSFSLGITGFVINIAGIMDGPLPGVDIFTMFLQGLVWVSLLLQAPLILPVRLLLIPVFFLSGFIWDALGAFPHLIFLNFIPLTLVVAYLLNMEIVNYIVVALPAVFIVKLILWASPAICVMLNEILILLETPCQSFLSQIPLIGWLLRFIIGC